jgi:hypothetical protein
VAQAGTSQAVVVVEPLVTPAGTDADVDRKPTAATEAGANAGKVGMRGEGHTPSDTLEEYYQMELSQPFLFLLSLCAWIVSSVMVALLTNSRKVLPVLSARHPNNLVESTFMKRSFFFPSVSTCSRVYCSRCLKSFEYSCTDLPPFFRSMNS